MPKEYVIRLKQGFAKVGFFGKVTVVTSPNEASSYSDARIAEHVRHSIKVSDARVVRRDKL